MARPCHPPNLASLCWPNPIRHLPIFTVMFMVWHPNSSGVVQFHDLASYNQVEWFSCMIWHPKSSGVVTLPFLPVRVVCLAWLKRRSSQILNTMDEMGHAPKWRGKCIRACESFCWRWLMRQGFSSVAVGCRRPCSPEAMAAALKKWVHVLREAIR